MNGTNAASRDRRQAPRVLFCDPVEILGDQTRLSARALDVSTDGIGVDIGALELGTRVRVRFSLGDASRQFDSVARVVRSGPSSSGLRFESISWVARANLGDYVDAVRSGTRYPPLVWH